MTTLEWMNRMRSDHEVLMPLARRFPDGRVNPLLNLAAFPAHMVAKVKMLQHSEQLTESEAYLKVLSEEDWVTPIYNDLLAYLPDELRARFTPNERFAVGICPTGEINAQTSKVPEREDDAYAILFNTGLFQFVSIAAKLIVIFLPTTTRHALINSNLAWHNAPVGNAIYRAIRSVREPLSAMKWSPMRIAATSSFRAMFETYAALGTPVATVPKEYAILGSPLARIGHVLECYHHLAESALHFIMCHEMGHVALGHSSSAEHSGLTEEFAADAEAFSYLTRRDDNRQDLVTRALCGATFFLSLAECAQMGQQPTPSHPPAADRIDKLFDRSHDLYKSKHHMIKDAIYHATNIRQTVLSQASTCSSKQEVSKPLDRLIEKCVLAGSANEFYDTFPRWLIYGATQKLCRSVAEIKTQIELEKCYPPYQTGPNSLKDEMISFALTVLNDCPSARDDIERYSREYQTRNAARTA